MLKNKKILIVIPARGGSKGIKLKNLKKINNKSLLQITIDFAKLLNFVDCISVNSDHKKILDVARKNKILPIVRPKKLSHDYVSDFKILKHSIKNIEKFNKKKFDIVIYLQPTSLFRTKKIILDAVKKLINQKLNSIWSASKVSKKYHPKKIIIKTKKNYLKLNDKSGENIIARQQLKDIYIRNGLFYIFNIKSLLNEKKIYLKKSRLIVINKEVINIDNLNDLKRARNIFKKKI